ncbi:AAA family ATPase [Glaciecola siphonariae]|uniref:AAA family ATPase n=1 Tax=Glaciecola siphonariae TaxID=521012 RepID=A0ABV9LZI0_9ALTE
MINNIQIIPPTATYVNQVILTDLRRINFFFGANGTGKTTISRVLAGTNGFAHCPVTWDGGIQLESMVYNRDFIDRNFNQDGPLQGVFTLGEDQVEAERKIAELQPEIGKIEEQISSLNVQLDGDDTQPGKRVELDALEPNFTEKCFRQKRQHDSYFQEAFSGVRGNAEKFKAKVLTEHHTNSAELFSLDILKDKAETVFSSDLERVSLLGDLSSQNLIQAEDNPLLQKVIVGNQDIDIAALIDKLGNSDWVKQGRQFHAQDSSICPFCQQSTDEDFAASLDAFFSDAYDNDIVALQQLKNSYREASEYLSTGIQRVAEQNNPFLKTELFNAEAQAVVDRLKVNLASITRKLNEPSRRIELEPMQPLLDKLQLLIAEANEASNYHNQTAENIGSERETLKAQVWRYVLNKLDTDLNEYHQRKDNLNRTISGMEQSLNAKNECLQALKGQIKDLEKLTTSIQPTINAINGLLTKFGFNSFELGDVGDGIHYQLLRANGEEASSSLSEGEKTFITFLYFYHLIKGAQSPSGVTASRVVVFDDPISSLDSDVLYIVSSLIKSVMDEARDDASLIKQVFVLTHNVYFHKEISFNQRRTSGDALSDESFWLVKKSQSGSEVTRCQTNPIRSAYELLWEDVRVNNISSTGLQNTLRRILENYFSMWGGMSKDEICALFDGRDKIICQSLFSWVNDGSHSIHDDLYINHGEQTNESYLRVFKEIFVQAGQVGHYNMMTNRV